MPPWVLDDGLYIVLYFLASKYINKLVGILYLWGSTQRKMLEKFKMDNWNSLDASVVTASNYPKKMEKLSSNIGTKVWFEA